MKFITPRGVVPLKVQYQLVQDLLAKVTVSKVQRMLEALSTQRLLGDALSLKIHLDYVSNFFSLSLFPLFSHCSHE